MFKFTIITEMIRAMKEENQIQGQKEKIEKMGKREKEQAQKGKEPSQKKQLEFPPLMSYCYSLLL